MALSSPAARTLDARRMARAAQSLEYAREHRDDVIRQLHRAGFTAAEIAELAGLTRQRIYQLLRSSN